MIEIVKDISYIKKTLLSSSEYFKLEIDDSGNTLKYIDDKYKNEIKRASINKIKDEFVNDYLDNLFRVIDSWEEKYISNNTLDGIEWQLQITYKDGYVKYYSGKNDFPNNFEALDRIKYELIEKSMEENA